MPSHKQGEGIFFCVLSYLNIPGTKKKGGFSNQAMKHTGCIKATPALLLMFLILTLISSGCAPATKGTRPSRQSLEEAVAGYWNLRVSGDKVRSFEYERVSLRDSQEIRDAYMRGFSRDITIKGFRIKGIGDEGTGPDGSTPVRIVVKHSPKNLPFQARDFYEIELTDLWQNIDGIWYHLLADPAGIH